MADAQVTTNNILTEIFPMADDSGPYHPCTEDIENKYTPPIFFELQTFTMDDAQVTTNKS